MSDRVETEKLCQRWIVGYYCWRMLQEFCKSGTLDEEYKRRLLCYENPPNFGDRKTHGCRLLVHFVCKIVEAGKEMSEEKELDGTLERTTMEEALDLVDYISNAFTRLDDAELAEVQLCLRCYAVLIPLYKDDRVTAKAVYDRQWLCRKNSEEMKFRNPLAAMIADRTIAAVNPDFSEVVTKCQRMLEKIMTGMSKPFMLQVAERVCQKRLIDSSTGDHPQTKSARDNDKEYMHVAGEHENLTAESNDTTKSSSAQCNGKATVSHAISSVDDLWHPSTQWRLKGATKTEGRQPWSSVEEEQLYKGVLAHGIGNWATIHTHFVPTRSNVDIKDKWRTMNRQGRLQTLADKLGPLPIN